MILKIKKNAKLILIPFLQQFFTWNHTKRFDKNTKLKWMEKSKRHIDIWWSTIYSLSILINYWSFSNVLSKQILNLYNQDTGMTPENAKITFLKYVHKWPTFGSAFFEVKVSHIVFLIIMCNNCQTNFFFSTANWWYNQLSRTFINCYQ